MGARLRCSPISCQRIRERLGSAEESPPCSCSLPDAPDSYPHPLLHLRTLPEDQRLAPAERDPDSTPLLAEALARLRTCAPPDSPAARDRDRAERSVLERRLARRLEELPDRAVRTPSGTHALVDRGGLPAVEFTPAARPADSSGEGSRGTA